MTAAPARSDAVVLFGATGDLARKKLLPAVYHLAERGLLGEIPVVGVASSDWDDDRLRDHLRGSLEDKDLDIDEEVYDGVAGRLSYLQGDYAAGATYEALAERLSDAECPLIYLAVPPFLFDDVIEGLSGVGLNERVCGGLGGWRDPKVPGSD